MSRRSAACYFAVFLAALASSRAYDLDTGKDAIGATKSDLVGPGWVRLRGVAAPEVEGLMTDRGGVAETRVALAKLRERGLKTCVLLRWPAKDWKVAYLPKNLREVYENGRKLGAAYGDLIDVWEIDNEPDLGAVPEAAERYTAFLKATYLGIKAGALEAQRTGSGQRRTDDGRRTADGREQQAPLVLMGSLGLPPGPWLERFAANDGFSYTDGFNYHYYGYPTLEV